jgi:hypothetical protein
MPFHFSAFFDLILAVTYKAKEVFHEFPDGALPNTHSKYEHPTSPEYDMSPIILVGQCKSGNAQ